VRISHTACIHGNNMYVIGGLNEENSGVNDVYILDVENLKWNGPIETRGKVPEARYWHCANRIGDEIYIFGGKGHKRG